MRAISRLIGCLRRIERSPCTSAFANRRWTGLTPPTPIIVSNVAITRAQALRAGDKEGPRRRLSPLRSTPTFATALLVKGAPISDVAAQLGAQNPSRLCSLYARKRRSGFVDRLDALRLFRHAFSN